MRKWTVHQGNNIDNFNKLEDGSIKTVVTSPPYFGLRTYGESDEEHGKEETPEEFVENLCQMFDALKPKLADDGTMWVNLGDTYAGNVTEGIKTFGNKESFGRRTIDYKQPKRSVGTDSKPKDLEGIPWLFAFAMKARGWYLRQDIIWSKNNPMPESVTDRCTKSHEYIFLFSKRKEYFFDFEAIKEPAISGKKNMSGWECDGTRRKRSVWDVAIASTETLDNEHFAVYPTALVIPCVLAGSAVGDLVCDPFNGSGTTGVVALQNDRNYVGFELYESFKEIYTKRLNGALEKNSCDFGSEANAGLFEF